MALDMRTVCERCGRGIAHDEEAYICSWECTFCASCISNLDHTCPSCAGELVRRPRRERKP